MGCYMSVPDNKVYVTEGKGKNFTYATASCQGWRREQEDAEDCIPYFDDDASLFILCDGHGGAEVAKYTVQHLPEFIKDHPIYKEGNYARALERAFIDFDALLRTDKVANELHKLAFDEEFENKTDDDKAGKESKVLELNKEETTETASLGAGSSSSTTAPAPATSSSSSTSFATPGPSGSACTSSSNNGSSTVVDDVDTDTLRREAQLPLRELLNEYSVLSGMNPAKRSSLIAKFNSSPVIRGKKEDKDEAELASSGSASSRISENQPGSSTSRSIQVDEDDSEEFGPSTSVSQESIKEAIMKQVMEKYFPIDDDSSEDSEFDGEDSSNDDDGDDEGDDEGGHSSSRKLRRKKHKRPSEEPMNSSSEDSDDDDDCDEDDEDESEDEDDDDDDDDEDDDDDVERIDPVDDADESFKKRHYDSSGRVSKPTNEEEEEEADDEEEDPDRKRKEKMLLADHEEGNEDDEEQENHEDDDDSDDDEDDQWEDVKGTVNPTGRTHKPGQDSGCTVVVALIKAGKLYVASAGDSRCIVIMRDGTCRPMSFDHKPEDPIERRRITRAGGRVTEGRVNGGLNLSRALGDFTYKSPELRAKDQMITPCPDVKVADLDPNEVEYIFLACDGIWNSMKNQQATRFIRKIAPGVSNNLVDICVHLFRKCIAPRTDGDGTGCDNMTCIIARFGDFSDETSNCNDLKTEQEGSEGLVSSSQKRSNNDDSNEEPLKRRCLRL